MQNRNELALQNKDMAETLSQVILQGDLSRLSPIDKVDYYNKVCNSMGLNPLTKPFEYIKLQGKEMLYVRKDATEQLRRNYGISIEIKSREVIEDVYIVTAKAVDKNGRADESIGAINITGLKGDARANAIMKAETKAKRRVTLSIIGLGFMDESEIESIPKATTSTATIIDESFYYESITPEQIELLKEKIQEANSSAEAICNSLKIDAIELMRIEEYEGIMRKLNVKIAREKKSANLDINKLLSVDKKES